MCKVEATALSFARRRFKTIDEQYVDECIAEANFWLVVLFEEFKEEILKQEDTLGYIRMRIGYKLKEYWAPYATSTMSYKKQKGETLPQIVEFVEKDLPKESTDIPCFDCLQSILKLSNEWDVYEHHLLNKTPKEIGLALNLKEKKVQKILAKIRKRLKVLQKENDANFSHQC